jgi:hypothetical protein
MQFNWLPVREDFDASLREVKTLPAAAAAIRLRELATSRLDLTQTSKLDRALLNALKSHTTLPGLEPLRLAILGSATTSHLPLVSESPASAARSPSKSTKPPTASTTRN